MRSRHPGVLGLVAAGLWTEEHPAGSPVDLHHQVFREMMRLVRVDRRTDGYEHFTHVEPGFSSEYRNGAIFITPKMWAWLCATHVAEAFKPEAVRLPWQD
jgi:hypothetical protein